MKVYIANFGLENYLWPKCRSEDAIAVYQDEDLHELWASGNKEGYIERCLRLKRTAKGIPPTRSVAAKWYSRSTVVNATHGDIWIHREKDELWWTVSKEDESRLLLEPAFKPSRENDRVYVLYKPALPWSNLSKRGNRLIWQGLHSKAKDFLFTESTLQALESDNSEYARALIEGADLAHWHSRPDWRSKEEAAKRSAVTSYSAKDRSIVQMAKTAMDTAASARGQEVKRTAKVKEFRFSSHQELESHLRDLLAAQEDLCALSGLPLKFNPQDDDQELLCSIDRIDSDGHYEAGNLQIVCRFVNRWKSDDVDENFRRLIELVRASG